MLNKGIICLSRLVSDRALIKKQFFFRNKNWHQKNNFNDKKMWFRFVYFLGVRFGVLTIFYSQKMVKMGEKRFISKAF